MGFTSSSSTASLDATDKFSSDLAHHAEEHIEFLRAMHAKGISSKDPPSVESLRRYRELWLPLVQQHSQTVLIPPDDIAWLWHCHRLAPKRYQEYVRSQFGPEAPTLEAKSCFAFQSKRNNDEATTGAHETIELWNAKYPKEDFFLSRKAKNKSKSKKGKDTTLNGFDLKGSCKRQAKFLWQVSGPHYSDPSFLQQGVQNYYQFLKLRTHSPKQILVPTLQIDLLWHTHILVSIDNYNRDCMSIMNSEFHHDDSIENADLEDYFKATSKLWKTHYHQDYFVEGGMDRGTPPKEYWKRGWAKQKKSIAGSNAANSSSSNIIWVWKETPSQLDQPQVLPNGWVMYNQPSNERLEQAFQNQEGQGTCAPMSGYIVNFSTLKQTKVNTGFERDVQRMEMVWCWEESQGNMSNHDATAIFGDPADRMIRYDAQAASGLETAYQSEGGTGTYSPLPGYEVDFEKMVQTKLTTGFEQTVQRVPIAKNTYDGPPKTPPEPALIEGKKTTTASSGMVCDPPAQVASSGLVDNSAESSATDPDGTPPKRSYIEDKKTMAASSRMVYISRAQVPPNGPANNPTDSSTTDPDGAKKICTCDLSYLCEVLREVLSWAPIVFVFYVAGFMVMMLVDAVDDSLVPEKTKWILAAPLYVSIFLCCIFACGKRIKGGSHGGRAWSGYGGGGCGGGGGGCGGGGCGGC